MTGVAALRWVVEDVTAEVPAVHQHFRTLERGKQDKDVRPQHVKGSWWCELWLTPVSWLQTSAGAGSKGGARQRVAVGSAARCDTGLLLVPSVTGGEGEAC